MNIFLKTAILTTLIFFLGLFVGIFISSEKVSELESEMHGLQMSIENIELEFLFLDTMKSKISCAFFISEAEKLGEETGKLASQVERYENMQKIDDSEFKELKSRYTLTLIRDWLTLEKIKQACNGTYITVLYFYSNKNCDKCEDQGMVLSFYKEKLKSDIQIFAIDGDLDLRIVSALKAAYNITTYPTLVINGKEHYGFYDKEDLKEIFCEYENLTLCNT